MLLAKSYKKFSNLTVGVVKCLAVNDASPNICLKSTESSSVMGWLRLNLVIGYVPCWFEVSGCFESWTSTINHPKLLFSTIVELMENIVDVSIMDCRRKEIGISSNNIVKKASFRYSKRPAIQCSRALLNMVSRGRFIQLCHYILRSFFMCHFAKKQKKSTKEQFFSMCWNYTHDFLVQKCSFNRVTPSPPSINCG